MEFFQGMEIFLDMEIILNTETKNYTLLHRTTIDRIKLIHRQVFNLNAYTIYQ